MLCVMFKWSLKRPVLFTLILSPSIPLQFLSFPLSISLHYYSISLHFPSSSFQFLFNFILCIFHLSSLLFLFSFLLFLLHYSQIKLSQFFISFNFSFLFTLLDNRSVLLAFHKYTLFFIIQSHNGMIRQKCLNKILNSAEKRWTNFGGLEEVTFTFQLPPLLERESSQEASYYIFS